MPAGIGYGSKAKRVMGMAFKDVFKPKKAAKKSRKSTHKPRKAGY